MNEIVSFPEIQHYIEFMTIEERELFSSEVIQNQVYN